MDHSDPWDKTPMTSFITQVPNGAKRKSDDDFKSPEKKDRGREKDKVAKEKSGKEKKRFADLVMQLLVPNFKRGRAVLSIFLA